MRCADHALEYRKLADIKPYQKNPRKNDKAVTAVANSIREYGFQSPIIVDRDGVIIAGHTRYKAAKRLRLSTVPVIVAAELTPEQAKELRIADNSTNEVAEWDLPVLSAELAQLTFDPAKFGLPVDLLTPVQPEEPEPEAEENPLERDRPYKAERSWQNTQISVFDSASPYGIPAMAPVEPVPDGIVWEGFNYALTETAPAGKGLHFFLDDYQFERVWASPDRYLDLLSRFDYVIAPDFSQYGNWPGALNLYNHYRKMWCAAYWQECGIRVVPYVIYREDLAAWALDGIPANAPICMSSVSDMNKKQRVSQLREEVEYVLGTLRPSQLLWYGAAPEWLREVYAGPLIHIPPFSASIEKRIRK